jgi:hypothetical protein
VEGADELIRAIESAANLKLRQSHAPTAAVFVQRVAAA